MINLKHSLREYKYTGSYKFYHHVPGVIYDIKWKKLCYKKAMSIISYIGFKMEEPLMASNLNKVLKFFSHTLKPFLYTHENLKLASFLIGRLFQNS